jgi:hypothetical protein
MNCAGQHSPLEFQHSLSSWPNLAELDHQSTPHQGAKSVTASCTGPYLLPLGLCVIVEPVRHVLADVALTEDLTWIHVMHTPCVHRIRLILLCRTHPVVEITAWILCADHSSSRLDHPDWDLHPASDSRAHSAAGHPHGEKQPSAQKTTHYRQSIQRQRLDVPEVSQDEMQSMTWQTESETAIERLLVQHSPRQ